MFFRWTTEPCWANSSFVSTINRWLYGRWNKLNAASAQSKWTYGDVKKNVPKHNCEIKVTQIQIIQAKKGWIDLVSQNFNLSKESQVFLHDLKGKILNLNSQGAKTTMLSGCFFVDNNPYSYYCISTLSDF